MNEGIDISDNIYSVWKTDREDRLCEELQREEKMLIKQAVFCNGRNKGRYTQE